eukprot:619894-Pelagomonas_calceolata.AAC.1
MLWPSSDKSICLEVEIGLFPPRQPEASEVMSYTSIINSSVLQSAHHCCMCNLSHEAFTDMDTAAIHLLAPDRVQE